MSVFDELRESVLHNISNYSAVLSSLYSQKKELSSQPDSSSTKLIEVIHKQELILEEFIHHDHLKRLITVFEHRDNPKTKKEYKEILSTLHDASQLISGSLFTEGLLSLLKKQKLALHDRKFSQYEVFFKQEISLLEKILHKKNSFSHIHAHATKFLYLASISLMLFINTFSYSQEKKSSPITMSNVEHVIASTKADIALLSALENKYHLNIYADSTLEKHQVHALDKALAVFGTDSVQHFNIDYFELKSNIEGDDKQLSKGGDVLGLYEPGYIRRKDTIPRVISLDTYESGEVMSYDAFFATALHEIIHYLHITHSPDRHFNRVWRFNGLKYIFHKYEEKNLDESVADFTAYLLVKINDSQNDAHDMFTDDNLRNMRLMVRLHLLAEAKFLPIHMRSQIKSFMKNALSDSRNKKYALDLYVDELKRVKRK